LKAPEGARLVAIRGPGIIGQWVAAVVGDKAYMWIGCRGHGAPSFNSKARLAFEIVRDVSKREPIIGTVL